jgi:hypothetical protein
MIWGQRKRKNEERKKPGGKYRLLHFFNINFGQASIKLQFPREDHLIYETFFIFYLVGPAKYIDISYQ